MKFARRIIVIGGILAIILLPFLYFSTHKPDKIEQCKTFLIGNKNLQDHFGKIKSVRARWIGSGRSYSSKKGTSGYYSFWINGIRKRGSIKVHWELKNGKIQVSKISAREGFDGKRILWPENVGKAEDHIIASHVWDGIICLLFTALSYLFFLSSRKEGKLFSLFYHPSLRFGSPSYYSRLFLIATFGLAALSVLCFFNRLTLF